MKVTAISKTEERILTLPNLLTLLRLLLLPACLYAYLGRESRVEATLILLLSGLTDILDGAIARHTGTVSRLGKILDPIADKLTQIALLGALLHRYPLLLILALPLLGKEVVSGVAALRRIRHSGRVESSEGHGKLATVTVYTTILIHLLAERVPTALTTLLCGL